MAKTLSGEGVFVGDAFTVSTVPRVASGEQLCEVSLTPADSLSGEDVFNGELVPVDGQLGLDTLPFFPRFADIVLPEGGDVDLDDKGGGGDGGGEV